MRLVNRRFSFVLGISFLFVVLGFLSLMDSGPWDLSIDSFAIRRYLALSFCIMALILPACALWLQDWGAINSIEQTSRAVRALIRGDVSFFRRVFANTEYLPLASDVDKILTTLQHSTEEKIKSLSPVATPQHLRDEVKRLFPEAKLCVIANREPCIHNRNQNGIAASFPASGLVTALEPVVRACSGLWIGHGSGNADRETANRRAMLGVPPEHPEYTLKRVWLTREEENGYYYGFSNEGIWPLCHIAHTRPVFRKDDWQNYFKVNQKFADAFIEEMKCAAPVALIQDYHYALLPQMLRTGRPDAIVSLFWHIPWPNPEVIRICPWKEDILKGMLGADLIGFHTQYHCNNFLDSVDSFLEARVDRERFSVTIQGHTCYIQPFPISVEWPSRYQLAPEKIPSSNARLFEELSIPAGTRVGLGVDRLDYTKGIIERLLAVERLLEMHPEMVGKFVFVQISAPSRTHIKRYQDLDSEVRELASRINLRFHRADGIDPIMLRIAHHDAAEVFRYYLAADVCVVNSLHDGMNLVAKEYVAARTDNRGALVLSSFTGAARELFDALIINPYDIEETARAIYRGLTMSDEEAEQRMTRLRGVVSAGNVYAWAGRFLREISRIADMRDREDAKTATG